MGQTEKYSEKNLHAIRHINEYMDQIAKGTNCERTQELRERFRDIKRMSFDMFRDSYLLIQKLDGEQPHDPKAVWHSQLNWMQLTVSDDSYWDYSHKNLHEVRHFESYMKKIESGEFSQEEKKVLKEKLSVVLRYAVRLYFDAKRLLNKLDD